MCRVHAHMIAHEHEHCFRNLHIPEIRNNELSLDCIHAEVFRRCLEKVSCSIDAVKVTR